LAFQEENELISLITSIYCSDSLLEFVMKLPLNGNYKDKLLYEVGRRNAPYLDDDLVSTIGWAEYIEVFLRRLGYFKSAAWVDGIGNKSFLKSCRKIVRAEKPEVVWSFNMSSKELFEKKEQGVSYVLDQTIGNWEVYNQLVGGHYTTYKMFFREEFRSVPDELIQRNYTEIDLADKVIFGSEFAMQTFAGCGSGSNHIIPYGFDEKIFKSRAEKYNGGRLKFVFVGLLTPRKGIHLLLNVFSKLVEKYDIELTLVGGNQLPNGVLEKYLNGRIKYLASVPRSSIPGILSRHHCFVFPTLFEGGGIVLYEACASGLAIIQSKNCGDGIGNNNGVVMDDVTEEALEQSVVKLISDIGLLNTYMDNSYMWSKVRRWDNYRSKVRGLFNG